MTFVQNIRTHVHTDFDTGQDRVTQLWVLLLNNSFSGIWTLARDAEICTVEFSERPILRFNIKNLECVTSTHSQKTNIIGLSKTRSMIHQNTFNHKLAHNL